MNKFTVGDYVNFTDANGWYANGTILSIDKKKAFIQEPNGNLLHVDIVKLSDWKEEHIRTLAGLPQRPNLKRYRK